MSCRLARLDAHAFKLPAVAFAACVGFVLVQALVVADSHTPRVAWTPELGALKQALFRLS